LRRYKRVDAAAESLGLGLRRMYRWMERYGLTLKGVLGWPFVPESHAAPGDRPTPAAPKIELGPSVAPAKLEHNILRLTASDFTGPNRGEVGGPGSESGNADDLIRRYYKLRNS
jgi:hypothetical protein